MPTTYLIGDLHGDFTVVREFSNRQLLCPGDIVIQLGDFGFDHHNIQKWNKMFPTGLPHNVPFFAIDGNHENFHCGISPDATDVQEVANSLWYVPRGYVMNLYGVTYGFIGGACSIDRVYQGDRWDIRETITESQIDRLTNAKIDILITHTPGTSLTLKHFGPLNKKLWQLPHNWVDVSANRIEQLIRHLRPKLVVSGHMHRHIRDDLFGIRQWVLDINEIDVIPNNL